MLKHERETFRIWFKDKMFRLNRSDEAMLGIFYIILMGVTYAIVK